MNDLVPTRYCSACLTTFEGDPAACPNLACRVERRAAGWGAVRQPGDLIDRTYRVICLLAFGGAGVTYRVRAIDDDGEMVGPDIALKLLFVSRDHGSYVRRLATEAQILQELHHPNIVEYMGFVHRTGQSPYLLTRYEAGGSLLDHLKRAGTMSVRDAAHVGRQVCHALAKGHALGITHRDLKPENLLITAQTQAGDRPNVRVADFGIAKVAGSLGDGITRMGAFVGTPQYAAPEQFLGEPASPSSDVFSLGAVMIYAMTARPLVPDAARMDPADAHRALVEALPPSILRPSDSAEDCAAINAILERAMAPDPARRCSVEALDAMLSDLLAAPSGGDAKAAAVGPPVGSAAAFASAAALTTHADALTEMKSSSGIVVPADRSAANRSRFQWAAAAMLAAALVLGVAWRWAPWAIDGLPVIAPAAHEGVPGASAAMERAVRVARRDIRSECPDSKGINATLVVVMNADGTVRWARALAPDRAAASCFAGALRGRSSGVTLERPAKAKLRIRL